MSTVATRTTHPALVLRNAVDAITTEFVRADVAPYSISTQMDRRTTRPPLVSLSLVSRRDFDSACSLFNLDSVSTYADGDDEARVCGSGRFLGMFVTAAAPAYHGHRFDVSTIDNGPECLHCHKFANWAKPGEPCEVRDRKALADEIPADCESAVGTV